jgi:hypothetical protein
MKSLKDKVYWQIDSFCHQALNDINPMDFDSAYDKIETRCSYIDSITESVLGSLRDIGNREEWRIVWE